MTSCVVHEYCMELHKKYVNMVNFTANLPGYNVTVVIPQRKMSKIYAQTDFLKFDDKVKVVNIYKPLTYVRTEDAENTRGEIKPYKRYELNEQEILKHFTESHYDKFIYFSIFMQTGVAVPKIKTLLSSGYMHSNYLTTIYQAQQLIIPGVLHKYYGCEIINIINDFYEPILGNKYPHICKTLSYYNTSDGLKTAGILDSECRLIDKQEKTLDFVFAFTTMAVYRTYLSDFIHTHVNKTDKVLFFDCNKFNPDRNCPINQTEYYKLLKLAKFSLLAPATKSGRFSWFRLLEALTNRNIPLLLIDSNYEDAIDFANSDLFEIYKRYNLFVDYDTNINDKIAELNYEQIWDEIEQTEFIKKITTKAYNEQLFIDNCLS